MKKKTFLLIFQVQQNSILHRFVSSDVTRKIDTLINKIKREEQQQQQRERVTVTVTATTAATAAAATIASSALKRRELLLHDRLQDGGDGDVDGDRNK